MQKKIQFFSNDKLKSGFVFRELLKSYKDFHFNSFSKKGKFFKKKCLIKVTILSETLIFLLEKVLNIIMELYKNRSHIIDIILIITQKKN